MTHFYSELPPHIAAMRTDEAVAAFRAGAEVPGRGIDGLSDEQLDARPVPGTWTIRQIVLHLMDTDLIASFRMKRIIAEERPALELYDEVAFCTRLGYEQLQASTACEVFCLNRLLTAALLEGLPEQRFQRVAIHPEVGEMSLERFVRLYIHHLEHHMRFLREKRRLVERR